MSILPQSHPRYRPHDIKIQECHELLYNSIYVRIYCNYIWWGSHNALFYIELLYYLLLRLSSALFASAGTTFEWYLMEATSCPYECLLSLLVSISSHHRWSIGSISLFPLKGITGKLYIGKSMGNQREVIGNQWKIMETHGKP